MFNNKLGILASDDWGVFAVLQSMIHEVWARQFSTTLETRLTYTPTDCFTTFPFCQITDELREVGKKYHHLRERCKSLYFEGLTGIYNKFHDSRNIDPELLKFRDVSFEMEKLVRSLYGFSQDFELNYFMGNDGERLGYSEAEKKTIILGLLELNSAYFKEDELSVSSKSKKKVKSQSELF